jgi:hypothetical protein
MGNTYTSLLPVPCSTPLRRCKATVRSESRKNVAVEMVLGRTRNTAIPTVIVLYDLSTMFEDRVTLFTYEKTINYKDPTPSR